MEKIKIIALDLDGTLTNEQKVITPLTELSLMMKQQEGVRLCLASGRPPYGMKPLAEQLRLKQYGGLLLCYNGGHVEDCTTGEVLVEIKLDEALLPELYRFQQLSGMTLMTYHGSNIYTEHPDDPYVLQSSRNNKMEVVKVDNFINDIPRPINKCLMVGSPELVQKWEPVLQQAMEGRMHICHSTPYFIELLPLGIDKGPSLLSLLRKIDMKPENLMAFGDSFNDVSMLKAAGIGVAMGNAEEEIKSIADYVTDSNECDGIAKALQYFEDRF